MISFYFYKYSLILLISIIISKAIYIKYNDKNKQIEKKEENNESILYKLKKYIKRYKTLIVRETNKNNNKENRDQHIDMFDNNEINDEENKNQENNNSDVEKVKDNIEKNENIIENVEIKEDMTEIKENIIEIKEDIAEIKEDINTEQISIEPLSDIYIPILNEIQDIINSKSVENNENISKDNLLNNNVLNENVSNEPISNETLIRDNFISSTLNIIQENFFEDKKNIENINIIKKTRGRKPRIVKN